MRTIPPPPNRHAARAWLVAAGALALAACSHPDRTSCLGDLAAHRASIDASFLADDHPLSHDQKAAFEGLRYFAGDADFCVPATFTEIADGEAVDMPTFNEASIPFRRFGAFEFRMGWRSYTLAAFQRTDLPEDERQWVLVPFRDATNGDETYGGGRYLEIPLPIETSTVIDFNRASNPWCAYQARYTCPIPPRENWLEVAIAAGEKIFKTTDAH